MTSYSKLEKPNNSPLWLFLITRQSKASATVWTLRKRQPFPQNLCGHKKKKIQRGAASFYIQGNKVKTVEITYPSQKLCLSWYLPRKTYYATWFFHILTYLYHSVWENSPQNRCSFPPLTSPFPRLSTTGIWPDGSPVFPWEKPRWMTNFPILYHHTVRRHVHGGVAHRAAGNGRVGRRGRKVLSGSQQLQRTLINLQSLFFP